MNKKKIVPILFVVMTLMVLIINIVIIVVFSSSDTVDNSFYSSLNIAALVISFCGFATTCFFSLALYMQSVTQTKINDKLPKRDDQYITDNYSYFSIEKEFSVFSINDNNQSIIGRHNYLTNKSAGNVSDITRLVFLPTDSVNSPTYKVQVNSLELCRYDETLTKFGKASDNKVDTQYSSNILQRGYNCICVDLDIKHGELIEMIDKANYVRINLDIISMFNVQMNVTYNIKIDSKKDVSDNKDVEKLSDMNTYIIHHTNSLIKAKEIVDVQ